MCGEIGEKLGASFQESSPNAFTQNLLNPRLETGYGNTCEMLGTKEAH